MNFVDSALGRFRCLTKALLLFLLPLLAASQDAPPTIRTETRAVQIDVAVRDAHGAPARGLTKDDFTLLDDGEPRAIEFFSEDAGQPAPMRLRPAPGHPRHRRRAFYRTPLPRTPLANR